MLFILVLNLKGYSQNNTHPENFNQFWKNTTLLLEKVPLTSKRISSKVINDKAISLIKIKSFNNIWFYVWVAEPNKKGKYTTKIRFSGFGKGVTNISFVPKGDFMMEKNTICMRVDVRGQGLSTEEISFDQYLINGIESKETYIYRGAFMDAVRTVDFASNNILSNGVIVVLGGSQGGLLSLIASALNPKVDICVAKFPFFADLKEYKKNAWPLAEIISSTKDKNLSYDSLMSVLQYFDAIYFAKLINAKVFMSCGNNDKITPYEGALKVYQNIPNTNKLFYVVPCEGHGCASKSNYSNKLQENFVNYYIQESLHN